MVFSNLGSQEKDAFFGLLDEYFQSRPQISAALKSKGESPASTMGRVASAASSFSHSPPTNPHRRTDSNSSAHSPPPSRGLVTEKKMGSLDTTSKTAFFVSSLKKAPIPSNTPPIAPAAFSSRKNNFAPPPGHATVSQPESTAAEEEEVQGVWAEALYDYSSTDPNDLRFSEGQQIWVTEQTSDDWWSGQVDGQGKSGLFPASYVKNL